MGGAEVTSSNDEYGTGILSGNNQRLSLPLVPVKSEMTVSANVTPMRLKKNSKQPSS